jgi:hypothetical protein
VRDKRTTAKGRYNTAKVLKLNGSKGPGVNVLVGLGLNKNALQQMTGSGP